MRQIHKRENTYKVRRGDWVKLRFVERYRSDVPLFMDYQWMEVVRHNENGAPEIKHKTYRTVAPENIRSVKRKEEISEEELQALQNNVPDGKRKSYRERMDSEVSAEEKALEKLEHVRRQLEQLEEKHGVRIFARGGGYGTASMVIRDKATKEEIRFD